MIVSYYQYNQLDPIIESFINRIEELKYHHYASELLKSCLKDSDYNLDLAVRKAIAICKLTGIPVKEHFIVIYRSDATGISRDWKLSNLASGILIISSDISGNDMNDIQRAFLEYLGV